MSRQAKRYKTLRPSPRIKNPAAPPPGVWSLWGSTLSLIKKHWKKYASMTFIYSLLVFFFVKGPVFLDVGAIREELDFLFAGAADAPSVSNTLFNIVVSEGTRLDEVSTAYGTFLLLIFSLAFIWLIRQLWQGKKPKVSDSFFKGMFPLVSVVLVGAVISLQLLPVAFGALVYSIAIQAGLLATAAEHFVFASFVLLLMVLSAYWLSSSLVALYIATLPNVRPLAALANAKELVKHRRWLVFRRMLGLPVLLILFVLFMLLLSIAVWPQSAPWVWWISSLAALPVAHTYLYGLYRGLI